MHTVSGSRQGSITKAARHLRPYAVLFTIWAFFISLDAYAADNSLALLIGKWVSKSEGSIGEPVIFIESDFGFEAILPHFDGLTSVVKSNGEFASNIKIESKKGEVCYYNVTFPSKHTMIWALSHGGPECSKSAEFAKTSQEPAPSATVTKEYNDNIISGLTYIGPALNTPLSELIRVNNSFSVVALPFDAAKNAISYNVIMLGERMVIYFVLNQERSSIENIFIVGKREFRRHKLEYWGGIPTQDISEKDDSMEIDRYCGIFAENLPLEVGLVFGPALGKPIYVHQDPETHPCPTGTCLEQGGGKTEDYHYSKLNAQLSMIYYNDSWTVGDSSAEHESIEVQKVKPLRDTHDVEYCETRLRFDVPE